MHKFEQLTLFDDINDSVNDDNPFEPEYFCENCCDKCNVRGDNCFHNTIAYGYDNLGNRIVVACKGQKHINIS